MPLEAARNAMDLAAAGPYGCECGALDLAFSLRVGMNLAKAIGQAHKRGIFHKDMAEGPRELLYTRERVSEAPSAPIKPRRDHQASATLESGHALVSVHDSGPGLDQASRHPSVGMATARWTTHY
jgi:hypothetical protein